MLFEIGRNKIVSGPLLLVCYTCQLYGLKYKSEVRILVNQSNETELAYGKPKIQSLIFLIIKIGEVFLFPYI